MNEELKQKAIVEINSLFPNGTDTAEKILSLSSVKEYFYRQLCDETWLKYERHSSDYRKSETYKCPVCSRIEVQPIPATYTVNRLCNHGSIVYEMELLRPVGSEETTSPSEPSEPQP